MKCADAHKHRITHEMENEKFKFISAFIRNVLNCHTGFLHNSRLSKKNNNNINKQTKADKNNSANDKNGQDGRENSQKNFFNQNSDEHIFFVVCVCCCDCYSSCSRWIVLWWISVTLFHFSIHSLTQINCQNVFPLRKKNSLSSIPKFVEFSLHISVFRLANGRQRHLHFSVNMKKKKIERNSNSIWPPVASFSYLASIEFTLFLFCYYCIVLLLLY